MSQLFKSKILFILLFNFWLVPYSQSQTFKKAPGGAIDVSIDPNNGKVYVIGTSKEVFYFNSSANKFKPYLTGASGERITVNSKGEVWIVRQNKKVAKVKNSKWEDVKPFSYSKDIDGDGKGNIWSVFATNGKVVKYENGKWKNSNKYGSLTTRIAARNSSDVWTIRQDQTINHYFKNKLNRIKGKALDIAIDAITMEVYVVGISKRIFKWNPNKKDWDLLPGTRNDVSNIAVHNNEMWCTTNKKHIYYTKLSNNSGGGASNDFSFSKNKKKVVILLHGITASTTTTSGRSNGVGTHRYPQFYWGYDFIRHIVGVNPSHQIRMLTPPGSGLVGRAITFDKWGNHYQGIASFMSSKIKIDKYAFILRPAQTDIDVMCTFRDGADGLMNQTKAAINQIYDTYQKFYGKLPTSEQPMIYLLGHSFGGIVSRSILSNPSAADRNNIKLSTEDRRRADFIRNRTVWLTTLATPHEGSPLPNKAHQTNKDLKDFAQSLRKNSKNGIADGIDTFRKDMIDGTKPCLSDIKYNSTYLNGILKPDYAKRSNGKLIPIYTMTGANPGHVFYLHKRALGSIFDNSINDIIRLYKDKEKGKGYHKLGDESFQLFLLDKINSSDNNYWPRVYRGGQDGDKFKITAFEKIIDEVIRTGVKVEMRKDNYFDSDGFVSFNSGHGLKLNGNKVGYFSGLSGKSWYRIYGKNYGSFHPWDLENHRSICFNRGTGAFIGNYLMQKGPNSVRGYWSSWKQSPDSPNLKKKRIRIEFTYLQNFHSKDIGSDGHRVEVKIGNGPYQKSGIVKEKKTIDGKHFQTNKDYIWHFSQGIDNATLVPVIVKVFNYRALLDDQLCSASPRPYVEELVFYVDAQNNRVYGDVEGKTGSLPLRASGTKDDKRSVALSFRVEVENM